MPGERGPPFGVVGEGAVQQVLRHLLVRVDQEDGQPVVDGLDAGALDDGDAAEDESLPGAVGVRPVAGGRDDKGGVADEGPGLVPVDVG